MGLIYRVLLGLLGWGCLWALAPHAARAQKDTSAISADSAQRYYYQQEQLRARRADTVRLRKDGLYRRAKTLSKRGRIWGELYRTLFREPDNPLKEQEKPKTEGNSDRRFRRFEGRVIRRIVVRPLDVFGAKVYDTLAEPRNILERAGNALHRTTRARVVRHQLSFKEGDRFASTLVSNNERVLRSAGILVDARIIPVATRYRDSVDVVVITQDLFSLSGGVSPEALDRVAVDLAERNFLGLNHRYSLKYEYIGQSVPRQLHNFRGYYFIPYLRPRSFVSAEAEALVYFNAHNYRARVFKDFLFTTTRTAGSAEVRLNNYYIPFLSADTIATSRVREDVADAWLGRAWPAPIGPRHAESVRLVAAGRFTSTTYRSRPFVSADSNLVFRNRQLVLGSLAYVERNYFRAVMINGYGRTEDVPYGRNLSATAGLEFNEDGRRPYGGLRYAQGGFLNRLGYINVVAEAGSFLAAGRPEQTTLRADALYFTPLLPLGRIHLRQFARLRFVHGAHRFGTDFLNINSDNGLRGISSGAFLGIKSLVLNLETVAFLNFDVLSFKAAPFTLADLGWIAPAGKILLDQAPYLGIGGGLRLYNERLTLGSVQIRLLYYPNVPDITGRLRPNFGASSSFPLQDFAVQAPGVVRFQ